MERTVLYSEIFKSIQGEGHYTGVPTTWLRFFGCNLECNGFGQDDPTDPSTYKLPYKDFDIIDLLEKTESCVELQKCTTDPKCWWCMEREWAIKEVYND